MYCSCYLGELLASGHLGEARHDLALPLYWSAAQKGSAVAQRRLGVYYSDGTDVEMDLKLASELYEAAAEQGDEYAANNLAIMYERKQRRRARLGQSDPMVRTGSRKRNSDGDAQPRRMLRSPRQPKQRSAGCRYLVPQSRGAWIEALDGEPRADIHFRRGRRAGSRQGAILERPSSDGGGSELIRLRKKSAKGGVRQPTIELGARQQCSPH